MKNLRQLVENELNKFNLTHASDINEILLGFYLIDGNWSKFANASDAQKILELRKNSVDQTTYDVQAGRAAEMAKQVQIWTKSNGFDDQIQRVWWTARQNTLSQAIGRPVNWKLNPTDILIDYGNGKFLGLSAKSTHIKADIPFKNVGMGSLGKVLDIDFGSLIKNIGDEIVQKYNLPAGQKVRKIFIRQNKEVQEKTVEAGNKMLNILRDVLLKKYQNMDQEELRKHILTIWLNAAEADPYYIKVTGRGDPQNNFSAVVEDFLKNDKLKALASGKLSVIPTGDDSVGISADNKRILRIRFKFSSEKLASSIKLSGDPWNDVSQETSESNWFRKQTENILNKKIDDYKPGDSPKPSNNLIDPGIRPAVSYVDTRKSDDDFGTNKVQLV